VAGDENGRRVRRDEMRGFEDGINRVAAGDEEADAGDKQCREQQSDEHEVELLLAVESPCGQLWPVFHDSCWHAGQPFAIRGVDGAQVASGPRKRSAVAKQHDRHDSEQQNAG